MRLSMGSDLETARVKNDGERSRAQRRSGLARRDRPAAHPLSVALVVMVAATTFAVMLHGVSHSSNSARFKPMAVAARGDVHVAPGNTAPHGSLLSHALSASVLTTTAVYLPWLGRIDLLLPRVADFLAGMDLSPRAEVDVGEWAWKGGVGMIGLLSAYEQTGDERYLDAVAQYFDAGAKAGYAGHIAHPNHCAPAWVALELHRHRPEQRYLALAERGVRWLMDEAPRAASAVEHRPGELWVDTLFMSAPLMATYGSRFNRPDVLNAAAREVRWHADRLQDPATGLWFHGWSAESNDHMSGGFWARGNGWAALATSEVLRLLPPGHPQRAAIERSHVTHLRALLRHQDGGGMWRTVLDRPDFYLETSGSAAIAAAIFRGVADGLIEPEYAVFAGLARDAVARRVSADGAVRGVSAGTGVPSRAVGLDIYGVIETRLPQAYGQALTLLMLAAADEANWTAASVTH